MMPEISVSENTWERLKLWAVPLEDTPDDALNRLLDFAEQHRSRDQSRSESEVEGKAVESNTLTINSEPLNLEHNWEDTLVKSASEARLPRGQKVSNEEYYAPILLVLFELGGAARASDVLDGVEKKMKHLFTEVDYQDRPSGGISRWKHTAHWARNTMVHQLGLLSNDSPHGVWELSEAGIAKARRLSTLQH